jgi:HEAT repeat protein
VSVSRQEIARIVDRIEHPDAHVQQEAVDELVALGPEAVEPLVANLTVVEPRARRGVIRALGEIGDDRALLPLMRYVWDERDSVEEVNGRGLAMQAITRIAGPEHADKLFSFLMDIRDDDDPFVRGYAYEAMGRFGDRRALPLLREAMNQDPEDFVRERAQRAMESLDEAEGSSLRSDMSDAELLQKIRGSTGGAEREYHINALLERDNSFELASELMRTRGKGSLIGLQVLQRLDDPRARKAATQYFYYTDDDTRRAICLRIVGAHLAGDADEDERAMLRDALRSGDEFVRLAALAAAGASGDEELVRRALGALRDRDPVDVATAAEALSRGMHAGLRRLTPEVFDALGDVRRRRLRHQEREIVVSEAYLLRALVELLSGGGLGTSEAQRQALASLEESRSLRPIVVTALDLLDEVTPEEPLEPERRWGASETRHLVELIDHPDEEIRWRVIDLLHRGAPSGMGGVARRVERLLYEEAPRLENLVIPVLARAGGEAERRLLSDLSEHEDEDVREAAAAALRKLRNDRDVIDAEIVTRTPD